jgi:hypothetical protein
MIKKDKEVSRTTGKAQQKYFAIIVTRKSDITTKTTSGDFFQTAP